MLLHGLPSGVDARLSNPSVSQGEHVSVHVTYAASAEHLPSASVAVDVRGAVTPARTWTYVGGTAVRKKRTVRLTVVVTGTGVPTGTVQIRDGHRLVRTATLSAGRVVVRLKGLQRGRHALTATYLGSTSRPGAQHTWSFRSR
jgi:hypothetical protein